jgi:hypothetical protein
MYRDKRQRNTTADYGNNNEDDDGGRKKLQRNCLFLVTNTNRLVAYKYIYSVIFVFDFIKKFCHSF